MRVLVQRVSRATVSVDGEVISSIGLGYLLLVGVGRGDEATQVDRLADKVVGLRIFRDADGKTNLAIANVDGEALVVSQFTLYADTRKGRRPSFVYAADPEEAAELVEAFAAALEARGLKVARGVFGAEMEVELVNDGPFTMWLEAETS
ncbi:MAG: D-aminoacyl-tRNA deacylase [Actinomycetota bacterium]|nr:D-aminoacyl-tRNA deacylase [Actinomycetota bacterium]